MNRNASLLCPHQEVRLDGKMYMKEVLLVCGSFVGQLGPNFTVDIVTPMSS